MQSDDEERDRVCEEVGPRWGEAETEAAPLGRVLDEARKGVREGRCVAHIDVLREVGRWITG